MPELADTLVVTESDRLEQAEALVRGFCGWHIAPERVGTVTLRARGGSTLFLPSMYVTDVLSIIDDASALTVETDYTWSSAGVLTRLGYWGVGTVVTVEFAHGYLTVPAEVTGAVQAVAQRLIDVPVALTEMTAGPFTERYAGVFSAVDMETLRRYRIPTVA